MVRDTEVASIVVRVSLLLLSAYCGVAHAYRPFDSTDASVAGRGEFELELGPVQVLREGSERSFLAPAFVANFGISGEREIVLEGKLRTLEDPPASGARTSLVDTALSLKQVHRRGVLQGAPGPSIASECGVLLPTAYGEPGVGAQCAGIVSERWDAGTVHLNAALARTRENSWNRFLGVIVEGPFEWPVRPAFELFRESDTTGARTRSALIGAIWRARKDLSIDFGVRAAHASEESASEIRAGFTAAF